MVPAGDPRMEWTLCLVGAGIDGQSRSIEVMAIIRRDGLGEGTATSFGVMPGWQWDAAVGVSF
jgi:hypothetical protein